MDYQVGDWVETCNMLPGIVQSIDIDNDEVEIFYPHKAFTESDYQGGSLCSIKHCGVHKITPQYACILMSLGQKTLSSTYKKATLDWDAGSKKKWSEYVMEKYKNKYIKE